MRIHRLAAFVLVLLLVGACSAGASSTPSTSPSFASSQPSGTATRLEVKLTDALKVEPAEVMVPVGRAVTFVVTNAGAIAHEFFVGDEAAQAAHEKEMSSMGGMGHEDANGIALKPGETRELTITFAAPGKIIAGCHEPGHYAGGMKATIEIGS